MAAMKATMQAVMNAVRVHQYGGPEVLLYEEAPKPEAGPDEVLIRVYAAGVNPLDWKIRAGYLKEWLRFSLPMIPGWDVAGIVETAGREVSGLKTGDAVYGLLDRNRNGAYAEYTVSPAKDLAFKPKSLGFTQSAALPVTALAAWQSLFELGNLQAGQTVLIHGAAGGVGHMAVQFARWKGARVIATAAARDLDFVKSLGAVQVIDYQAELFENQVSGLDLVLDVVGGETQERSWRVLKEGGMLVSTVGLAAPHAVRSGVRAKELTVHSNGAQLTQIAALIDAGTVKPVVSTILPLADAAKAHEMIQTGQVRGKIVLKVRE